MIVCRKAFGLVLASIVVAAPVYAAEPNEDEMREAVLREMQNRGGDRAGENAVSADNALSGVSLTLNNFQKIACEKADGKAGYNCDYSFALQTKYYSNEGTAAGDRHADGMNALNEILGGGGQRVTTTSGRFVLSGKRWRLIPQ